MKRFLFSIRLNGQDDPVVRARDPLVSETGSHDDAFIAEQSCQGLGNFRLRFRQQARARDERHRRSGTGEHLR